MSDEIKRQRDELLETLKEVRWAVAGAIAPVFPAVAEDELRAALELIDAATNKTTKEEA